MTRLHISADFCRLNGQVSRLAIIFGSAALAISPTMAQDIHGSDLTAQSEGEVRRSAGGLDEIVVTARKVAENLQDVPVSITAFTGDALKTQNALSLSDVQRLTPSLLIRSGGLSPASLTFSIRGQFNAENLASSDPSVGVYVDGVYIARAYGINTNFLDIQNVQVLKGPQGTLFGRNTTGGAILIETNDPILDELTGSASITYGNFDYKSASAIINLPVVTDKVALRAAVEFADSDGYHRDSNTGVRGGERDHWNARLKLLVKPTDTLSIQVMGDAFEQKARTMPWLANYFSPTWSTTALTAGAHVLGASNCFADTAACRVAGFEFLDDSVAESYATPNRTGTSFPNFVDVKTRTLTGTVALETEFGEIKFVNGYRRVAHDNCMDMDGTSAPIYQVCSRQRLKQFSTELQFTGKGFDNRLEFAAGAFYFRESGTDQSRGQAYAAPINSMVGIYYGDVDNTSIGLYGQVNYALTDRLTATAGLRWSADRKGIIVNNRTQSVGTVFDPFFGNELNPELPAGATLRCDLSRCPDQRADEFTGISYTLGLDYEVAPDVLLYVKNARGFRSGGQNLRATAAVGDVNPFVPVRPEIATSYEAGLKSEWFDRRLRLNLAGYFIDMKDLQRRSIVTIDGVGTTILGNAKKAEIYGGELEANLSVLEGFQLATTLAYVHPKYTDYTNPYTNYDRKRDLFDGVARWQYSVSGIYSKDFDFGKLSLRADWAWLGTFTISDFNYFIDETGAARSTADGSLLPSPEIAESIVKAARSNAAGELSLRAALGFNDDRFEIAVWGKNLTNHRRFVTGALLNGVALGGNRSEPRTYGVTLSARF